MTRIHHSNEGQRDQRDLQLEKLGIRQIHERIEVSPIITDPGTMGLDVEDGSPKTYICTINFKDMPINPTDIG
jgi:hypothetical protein